ncbi:MAG: hypothetical protein HZC36_16340 [Armatimonadetes bacterium]|nr:hypothetical protein [Armatimonadota bacterium]
MLALTLAAGSSSGALEPREAHPQAAGSDKAKLVLQRFLERSRTVAMTSIIEQPMQPGSKQTMQLKIVQDEKGRRRTTVLQPLSMQNITSVADGKKWVNYYPDERKMVVQDAPSPSKWETSTARMELASKNYRFEIEQSPEIAGQRVTTVVATPRSPEMPVRRFSIELSRYVLMRLETQAPNESQRTLFDVKAIDFDPQIASGFFEIKPLGDVNVVRVEAPAPLAPGTDAKALLGFQPVIPKVLPFGFACRTPEVTGEESHRMLAIQLSDGLATATVYQFLATMGSVREGSLERQISGIRIRVMSDLPFEVGRRLLDTFLKEAGKAMGPGLELSAPGRALKLSESRARSETAKRNGGFKDEPEDPLDPVVLAFMSAIASTCENL